ncbi:MAG: hypothetical protein K0U47_01045 [Epsilonproteobacteria bacterium]|nr:hypothetical protein [Campylobacterota bacterium]
MEEKLEESRPLKYEKITLGLQEQKLKNEKELPQNFEAIQFGLALHYMLEILESFSIKTLNNAYWGMKNRYEMILGEDKCEQIKQRVTNLLHYKPFLALVKGTIYKEQSIIYNKELKQLDLLIEQTNRWIIVDYKSSEQRQSEHVAQVLHYKKAIKKIVSKPVKAYLCYIREASIELIEI